MVSIRVEIDDEVALRLRELAIQEHRGEDDLAREALKAFVRARRPQPKGVGEYHSGRSDLAEQARALLAQDAAEGRWP